MDTPNVHFYEGGDLKKLLAQDTVAWPWVKQTIQFDVEIYSI